MAVKIEGYKGIAWDVVSEDNEQKVCIMIGDDREFRFDPKDITPINDLDYCASCGQIGCQHDGRERDESGV